MLLLLLACRPTPSPSQEACDACGGACLQSFAPAESRQHTTNPVDYPEYPPMSGNHDPCWAEWGIYTDPVRTENWVHNLEHGGVVVVYDPALAAEDVASLSTWASSLPEGRVILTPASQAFDGQVAAMAWERKIVLGCVDTATLDTFFWDHVGQGPEDLTTNPAATCSMDDTGDTAG